jgi:hypothetical protein
MLPLVDKKDLFHKVRRGLGQTRSPLIFQNSSAGVGTLFLRTGCRGFIGPVPLPLWIRAIDYSVFQVITHKQQKSPGAFPGLIYFLGLLLDLPCRSSTLFLGLGVLSVK